MLVTHKNRQKVSGVSLATIGSQFDRNRQLKFQMENRMTDERKWISDNRRHFLYLQIH